MFRGRVQIRPRGASRADLSRQGALALFGATFLWAAAGCRDAAPTAQWRPAGDGAYHVRVGEDIQSCLDAAARDPSHKRVVVHAGVYRPLRSGQALIQFNQVHDGIVLEASGDVVLTAANPLLADSSQRSYPAIVSHVVYFGDGVTNATTLRGFRITGANGYLATAEEAGRLGGPSKARPLEPHAEEPGLEPGLFFYLDGGAIKIFGRSYPTIERCVIAENQTRLCGGGVSVEHRGRKEGAVRIRDCVFRGNRCPATGSAIDVLEGSSAEIENCLFVGNIGNTGMDDIERQFGLRYNEQHGSGALTVFPNSSVKVERCTFTGNWNGADDRGLANHYRNSIFWNNTAGDGSRPGECYELDIVDASRVSRCFLRGRIDDLRGTISREANVLSAPDPQFDEDYRPRAKAYEGVGYRPAPGMEGLAGQVEGRL